MKKKTPLFIEAVNSVPLIGDEPEQPVNSTTGEKSPVTLEVDEAEVVDTEGF